MKTRSILIILALTTAVIACKKKETKSEEPAAPTTTTPTSGWVKVTSSTTNDLTDIKFLNNVGYAVGKNGTVLKTIDGGIKWVNRSVVGLTSQIEYCCILDTQTVWVSNLFNIYKTVNGGSSWTIVSTGLSAFFLNDIYFTSSLNGFMATSDGIASTLNGGTTWAYVPTATVTSFTTIKFTDANTGWSNGASDIYKTIDGGATWSAINEGLSQPQHCFFLNNNEAWAAKSLSAGDTIRKTTNGGTSWSTTFAIGSSSLNGMKALWFCDSNKGFQSRTLNTIQKTTDGGATWIDLSTPLTSGEDINKFYFVSPTVGWAVGKNGVILKYTE